MVGVALILVPLLAGRFELLRAFLGNSVFVVMSKLTYSVYLLHEALLIVFLGSSKTMLYLTHLEAAVVTLSMLGLSYILGGLMTLLVEAPLAVLDKQLLFPTHKQK